MHSKRLFAAILAAIMLSSTAITAFAAAPAAKPAPAASSSSTSTATTGASKVFENSGIVVKDKTTAAVDCSGKFPETTMYFYAADGKTLGSITQKAYLAIVQKYHKTNDSGEQVAPSAGGDWTKWFCAKFNEYRGVANGNSSSTSIINDNSCSSNSSSSASSVDISKAASEALRLANKERVKAGLSELEIDSDMMDLAAMRAEELAEKYSHERPDGTRMSTEYYYGEIINRKTNSAAVAISSWMASSGHKELLLAERYVSAGAGCYQDEDGVCYWVILFSK